MPEEIPLTEEAAAGLRRTGVRDAVLVRDPDDGTLLIATGAFADGLELRLAVERGDGPAADAFLVLRHIPRLVGGAVEAAWLAQAASAPDVYRFTAPVPGPEAELAGIWAAALDLPSIGAQDDFIDLGGDSLVAVEIIERAAEQGLDVSVLDLYQSGTVRALAAVMRSVEA